MTPEQRYLFDINGYLHIPDVLSEAELAALDADQLILVGVLLVSSLLNIAYLLPVAVTGFFAPPEGEEGGLKEAPVACVLPLCFTAASCIILFFYLDPFLALARRIGG